MRRTPKVLASTGTVQSTRTSTFLRRFDRSFLCPDIPGAPSHDCRSGQSAGAATQESRLSDPHSRFLVEMQRLVGFGKGSFRDLADRHAEFPVRRADRDVARITTETAGELRISNRDQGACFWNLIEVGDT